MTQTIKTKFLIMGVFLVFIAMLAAGPALACRPVALNDAYWQSSWTNSSRVALGRVVRVTPYSAAELARLNEANSVAPLRQGSGMADIEVVRDLKGSGPTIVRAQYQRVPSCWYRWAPAVGDTVMVFSGARTEAWPQERITLPRLSALFNEFQ